MLSLSEAQSARQDQRKTFYSFTSPGLEGAGSIFSHLLPLTQQILPRNETFFPQNPSQPQDSLLPTVKHSALKITHLTATAFQSIQDQRYRLLLLLLSTPVLHRLRDTSCKRRRESLPRASILRLQKRRKRASPAKTQSSRAADQNLTCLAAAARCSPPRCGRTVPPCPLRHPPHLPRLR